MPVTRVGHIAITQNPPERLEQNKHFLLLILPPSDTHAAPNPLGSGRDGYSVGNDKEVVGHGGDGLVVVVGDDDAVVLCPFTNHGFDVLNVHRVNLGERFIKDVEGRVAVQDKIQLGQAGFAAGELVDGASWCRENFGKRLTKVQ